MEHLLLPLIFHEKQSLLLQRNAIVMQSLKAIGNIIILKSRGISRKFATMKLLFFIGVSEELLFKMNCIILGPICEQL